MNLDPIVSAASTTTPTQAASPGLGGNRGEFLKLFVAQLQHQNPLDPMSGADMVAQLATFSQVEQSVEANKQLAAMAAEQASAAAAGLAALVGRTATADASTLEITGPPPPLTIHAQGAFAQGRVVVRDSGGNIVRDIPVGPGSDGAAVPWDGRDAAGRPLAAGTYSVAVELTNTQGGVVAASAQLRGVIDRVDLGPAGPRLGIAGARVAPGSVTSIAQQ